MKRLALVASGVAVIVAAVLFSGQRTPEAADHADSPANAMTGAESSDIGDIYAFTNGAADRVSFIMTFSRGTEDGDLFDTAVDYVFHLRSRPKEGSGAPVDYAITCEFSPGQDPEDPQLITCTLTDGTGIIDTVTGDIAAEWCSGADGPDGCEGDLRIYADAFEDPFFFNANGFEGTIEAIKAIAANLEFNEEGCPDIDESTAEDLVDCLGSDCNAFGASSRGADDTFERQNVQGIVIQVRRDAINGGGDLLDFWASTEVSGIQVDRAGRPAVTTALIGTFSESESVAGALRDEYNAASDRSGWNYTGELAKSLGIFDALNSTAE